MMYAVRKVGTNELLAKGYKYGFTAAKRPEDVWLFRRQQDANYRVVNNMNRPEYVNRGGSWVTEMIPIAWVEQHELEVVEVEIAINVRN